MKNYTEYTYDNIHKRYNSYWMDCINQILKLDDIDSKDLRAIINC